MLKCFFFTLTILISILAQAENKKYDTHFDNPIVDARIDFISCGNSTALIGLLTNDYGDVLCWGAVKDDTTRIVYAYLPQKTMTLKYYEQTEQKNTMSAGDEAAGILLTQIKLKELNPDFTTPKKAKVSTLKFNTQWLYSEGGTIAEGKLPGIAEKVWFSIFSLEYVDQDLEQFAGEIQ